MSEPYMGQILEFAGTFAPSGYMFCNGQLVSIQQYEALFTLIGTTYGGDGQTTFALPDLRGRTPIHQGSANFGNFTIGQAAGVENVTLNANQIPVHAHTMAMQPAAGTVPGPSGATQAGSPNNQFATTVTGATGAMLAQSGSGGAHSNLQPYLTLNYIIAVQGVYPSRN